MLADNKPLVDNVVNAPVEALLAPIAVPSIAPPFISTLLMFTSPVPFGVISILPFVSVDTIVFPSIFTLSTCNSPVIPTVLSNVAPWSTFKAPFTVVVVFATPILTDPLSNAVKSTFNLVLLITKPPCAARSTSNVFAFLDNPLPAVI